MKALNRLKNSSGFTITELLAAMLILLMVAGVVAAGVPVASNAFVKAVDGANAQALLSTTVSALRDELTDAQRVSVSDNQLTYYHAEDGVKSTIGVKLPAGTTEGTTETNATNRIIVQLYSAYGTYSNGVKVPEYQLVSDAAATKNLNVVFDSVTYADGVVTFKDLAVYNTTRSLTDPVVKTDLSIRVLE